MTMVGGFGRASEADHVRLCGRRRLGAVGQIRPATRKTLRGWLAEHCPDGDAEFALEGCTGWRYVAEELAAAGVGVHLGDPAEIAALRGPKKRAKTDRADARLLRTLLLEGRFPESWIPPAHVLEIRSLGRLYCTLMDERRAWQQRIHAQVFHRGCPPIKALLSAAGRERSPVPSCRRPDGSIWIRRCAALISSAARSTRCEHNWSTSRGARPGVGHCRPASTASGWLCAAIIWAESVMPAGFPVRSAGALRRAGCHRVLLGRQTLTGASVPAGLPGAAVGRLRGGQVRGPPRVPDYAYYHQLAASPAQRQEPDPGGGAQNCAAAITPCVSSAMPPWRCPSPKQGGGRLNALCTCLAHNSADARGRLPQVSCRHPAVWVDFPERLSGRTPSPARTRAPHPSSCRRTLVRGPR